MSKTVRNAIGTTLLAVLGIMTATSPTVATSNIAGWLGWAGVARVPTFLASAATDRIIQISIAVTIAVFATTWWHRRSAKASLSNIYKLDADRLNDRELGDRMDSLSYRLRQLRDRGWYSGGETVQDVMISVESLRITLNKQGFPLPYVPENPDIMEIIAMYDRYFTIVGKLLREGHASEARTYATRLAAENAPPTGNTPS
jgi:hypothetical protein